MFTESEHIATYIATYGHMVNDPLYKDVIVTRQHHAFLVERWRLNSGINGGHGTGCSKEDWKRAHREDPTLRKHVRKVRKIRKMADKKGMDSISFLRWRQFRFMRKKALQRVKDESGPVNLTFKGCVYSCEFQGFDRNHRFAFEVIDVVGIDRIPTHGYGLGFSGVLHKGRELGFSVPKVFNSLVRRPTIIWQTLEESLDSAVIGVRQRIKSHAEFSDRTANAHQKGALHWLMAFQDEWGSSHGEDFEKSLKIYVDAFQSAFEYQAHVMGKMECSDHNHQSIPKAQNQER